MMFIGHWRSCSGGMGSHLKILLFGYRDHGPLEARFWWYDFSLGDAIVGERDHRPSKVRLWWDRFSFGDVLGHRDHRPLMEARLWRDGFSFGNITEHRAHRAWPPVAWRDGFSLWDTVLGHAEHDSVWSHSASWKKLKLQLPPGVLSNVTQVLGVLRYDCGKPCLFKQGTPAHLALWTVKDQAAVPAEQEHLHLWFL